MKIRIAKSGLGAVGSLTDRQIRRLTVAGILVLVIGIPLLGIVYFLDRSVDAGPSLFARQVSAAEEAVRKEPNSIAGRFQLAQAYAAAGRTDDALRQYDVILAADPKNAPVLAAKGEVLVSRNDLDGAAKTLRQIVDLGGSGEFAGADTVMERAWFGLGDIAVKRGQFAEAVKDLEAALAIDKADADAWNLIGTAYIKTGDPAKAVDSLRRAVLFVPTGWCEPYSQLATAYTALGRASFAEYAAAMVDFCQKRPGDAKSSLAALVTSDAKSDAMRGLGLIAEAEGDRDAAIAWYQKVVAIDPTDFTALTGLSRLGKSPVSPATGTPSSDPHVTPTPTSPSGANG